MVESRIMNFLTHTHTHSIPLGLRPSSHFVLKYFGFNSYAIEYLNLHEVMLLTLPPRCSHLLQSFDVAAAQSLKSLINKIKIDKESIDFAKTLPTKTAMARRSVPSQVLINGFSHSGIYPFNPAKHLNRWKNAPPGGNFSPIIKHSKCSKC